MNVKLHHDNWGRLVFTDDAGKEHVGVDPIRAFPISDPGRGISILSSEGSELLWIEQLQDVEESTRRVLDEELAKRHFLPRIEKVYAIQGLTDTIWETETDHGRTKFTVKNDEDVRRVAGSRVIITDAHGIRYLILDYRQLDAGSRRLLERYI